MKTAVPQATGWRAWMVGWWRSRPTPTLAAVVAEGFLTRLGFSMLGFALPLYALSLGMSIAEIGLLYALRSAITIAIRPLMAWATDRFGSKRLLTAAVALRCVTGFLFVFATLPWHLYAIRLLHGAMTAAREPSAAVLLAVHADKRSLASTFAWYGTARDVGRSLGYAAAGLLIQATGSYRLVFVIACITSCAALFTVVRWVSDDAVSEKPSRVPATHPAAPSANSRRHGLLRYAGFGLMAGGTAEMLRGLFPVIATQYARLSEGEAGLVVSASALAVLVAGPGFGWLSDRISRALVLSTRGVANTVSSVLYIIFPGFAGFLVARVMDDMGKVAFRPTWGAILAEISEANAGRRARTMSFVDTAHSVGEALGPLLAGVLIAGFGVPAMLGVRAALAVATELQALWMFGNRRRALGAVRRESDGAAAPSPLKIP